MEMKVKKREWVKNAAIIFLAVMLLLTFFSNTIMNRSLPEVATQAVASGEITAKIRGTGTVEANESYQVTLDQTRKIDAVKIKVGDEVKKGQVLFTLSAAKSDELSSAQDAVDSAESAYQQALIDATKTSKSAAIKRASEALQDARTNFAAASKVSAAEVAAAKKDYDAKNAVTASLEAEYNKAKAALDNAGGWTPPSGDGDYSSVSTAQAALSDAQAALGSAKIQYQEKMNVFVDIAKYRMSTNGKGYDLAANEKALYDEFSADAAKGQKPTETSVQYNDKFTKDQLAEAYEAITAAQNKVNSAQSAYNSALNAYNASNSSSTSGNYALKVAADKANMAYMSAKVNSDASKAIYDNLSQAKTDYDTAKQAVYDKEDALSNALADEKSTNLSIAGAARTLAKAQEKYADLSKGASATQITSAVDGIVKTVDAVAGKDHDTATPLATIELPDQGYIVSFTVTNEQARKVHTGDQATVTNYYSGDVTATLQSIKPDPQNPQTNRILVFGITGDIQQGTSLTISVGQNSAQYDTIVPTGAIRSDANGDFVLVVVSKSSPLGNRYIATRVDIEKVASDDTNTAVTGGLNPNDYVITTSSKPINNKDHVKLADS